MRQLLTKQRLVEGIWILSISGLGLFLYHAFVKWHSWLAFAGLMTLIVGLAALGMWGFYRSWEDD